ncbi:hypothetical protein RO3G_06251 [Rhizopus delemar RA 99-880]|uniref:Uncharacterized protein n=1 Tax=Rhizopus delemar (strain RA 99-880 / ATCC MYA-4621 / FGSC 9543 / NRRL 43880) TaxID=246409 RepID=I1BZB6_RHIO9|nr:hypothetical protein RO3G_06251 [Rhizopus delemar RA 99-880]|eukprot:EIE81546.1 hypothetical protein RO3G_06251 [Rhizopus delemar RA 99-880]
MALKVYKKCKSPQGFKEDSTFFILSMTFLKWRDKLKMFNHSPLSAGSERFILAEFSYVINLLERLNQSIHHS